jgi:hypothetical protein
VYGKAKMSVLKTHALARERWWGESRFRVALEQNERWRAAHPEDYSAEVNVPKVALGLLLIGLFLWAWPWAWVVCAVYWVYLILWCELPKTVFKYMNVTLFCILFASPFVALMWLW